MDHREVIHFFNALRKITAQKVVEFGLVLCNSYARTLSRSTHVHSQCPTQEFISTTHPSVQSRVVLRLPLQDGRIPSCSRHARYMRYFQDVYSAC